VSSKLPNQPAEIICTREWTMLQGPGSSGHIPPLKRAVVLAFNWHAGLTIETIAIEVHVNARTAWRIDNRAKVSTCSPE